jgi:hypothetical protein
MPEGVEHKETREQMATRRAAISVIWAVMPEGVEHTMQQPGRQQGQG